MHAEAMAFVRDVVSRPDVKAMARRGWVLEFGSLNINGSVRDCFPRAKYLGVDRVPGPDVDVVADAACYRSMTRYDVVVCCEVLEHTPQINGVCRSAAFNLKSRGFFIVTCAGPGRPPHSAVDGGTVRVDEYYANVDPAELRAACENAGLVVLRCEHHPDRGDVYVLAVKP